MIYRDKAICNTACCITAVFHEIGVGTYLFNQHQRHKHGELCNTVRGISLYIAYRDVLFAARIKVYVVISCRKHADKLKLACEAQCVIVYLYLVDNDNVRVRNALCNLIGRSAVIADNFAKTLKHGKIKSVTESCRIKYFYLHLSDLFCANIQSIKPL